MEEIIVACILFMVSIISLILSIRSFREKGFLLNNAYLYASEKEREAMNKKPYYRQSGIVFLLIFVIFLLIGLNALLNVSWIIYTTVAITTVAVVYAIVSSIMIEKQKKASM
jgi:hypothetical protein